MTDVLVPISTEDTLAIGNARELLARLDAAGFEVGHGTSLAAIADDLELLTAKIRAARAVRLNIGLTADRLRAVGGRDW